MSMENWWNCTDGGKLEVFGEKSVPMSVK